jgi:hypothetical protein
VGRRFHAQIQWPVTRTGLASILPTGREYTHGNPAETRNNRPRRVHACDNCSEGVPPLGRGFLRLRNSELMTQGGELQSEVMPGANEGAEPSEQSREKSSHRSSLHD